MIFYFFSETINLFRYLSFRSIMGALTAFLLVLIFAPVFIEKLRIMKFGQQVRQEGPEAHLAKTGTPTMGGIFIWGSILISTLLWANLNAFVLIVCLSIVLFSTIGFMDDFAKIKHKNTDGLSPKGKLFFQTASALLVLGLTYFIPAYHQKSTTLTMEVRDRFQIIEQKAFDVLSNSEWTITLPPSSYSDSQQFSVKILHSNPETGKTEVKSSFDIPALITGEHDKQKFTYTLLSNNSYQTWGEITLTDLSAEDQKLRKLTYNFTTIYKARLFLAQFIPYYTEVVWYWPLWLILLFFVFIIIGVSNATNLADGLDGLATGMGISFYVPFGIFAYLMGNSVLSSYLFFPYISGIGELAVLVATAIGAFTGFLWYNVNPAQIFMGDTGSLPMGSTISLIAIMLRQELLLVIAGFIFVLETLSVIIQVFSYKKFKKRVFKMAPIHHHFELSGWGENQVVGRFWILSALCALVAIASIKVR